MYVFNSRSLAKPHAVDNLAIDLLHYKIDVALITETFFNDSHDSISVDSYHIFRKNRSKRKGGGVAVFVRDYITCKVISRTDCIFELLWLKLNYLSNDYICGVLYHPPNPRYNCNDLLEFLEADIHYLSSEFPNSTQIILGGDFNGLNCIDVMASTGLSAINKTPTRGRHILDNVYASFDIWKDCLVVTSCVFSDHRAIILLADSDAMLTIASKKKTIKFFRPHGVKLCNLFMANAPDINFDLCQLVSNASDLDFVCNSYFEHLALILEKFFPVRSITVNSSDPKFITAGIKSLLRKKNKLMRNGNLSEASIITETIRKMIIQNNSISLTKVNTRKACKTAWTRINKVVKPTMHQMIVPSDINARTLNDYYANISKDDNYDAPPLKHSATNNLSINQNTLFFDSYEIYCKMRNLRHSAMGPDNLPSWYLKLISWWACKAIANIYNDSIRLSHVPQCFKLAIISPIPKISKPSTASDWRPIAITNIIARIFDKMIVRKFFYPAIARSDVKPKFSDQYAFRPTGSCDAALISLLDSTTNYLTCNDYVNLLSIDMSKAFDTVKHSSVIYSLNNLQLPDAIYNWCISYLADRKQCTKFNNEVSSYQGINAGIIQGSGLGPILFLAVISTLKLSNDYNSIVKYADDCLVIIPQSHTTSIVDEINNLENWASFNNLSINHSKSKFMIISNKRKLDRTKLNDTINNISRVSDMTILGVKFQQDLSFNMHIDSVVTKCNRMFYCLRLLKAYNLGNSSINDTFLATIVAHITYCTNAWYGYCNKNETDRLQKVLKRGIKLGYTNITSNLTDIIDKRARKLFQAMLSNESHVLHNKLPPKLNTKYCLRNKNHGHQLPHLVTPHDTRNFIINMLYNY